MKSSLIISTPSSVTGPKPTPMKALVSAMSSSSVSFPTVTAPLLSVPAAVAA